MMTHNPEHEVGTIRQALAPGKMPVGVLLGAGCPLAVPVGEGGEPPLIPDVAGLTQDVFDCLGADKPLSQSLLKVQDQLTKDGRKQPNIEHILSHVRVLQVAAGADEARGLTGVELGALDTAICDGIVARVSRVLPGPGTAYHRLARWVGGIARTHPVELFTTNYDLLMEQALEETAVPYFDGFVGSHRAFFDPASMEQRTGSAALSQSLDELPSRWARLWKLHGSINWFDGEDRIVSRGSEPGKGPRRLIYPSHLKYDESQRMPYSAMFQRLAAFLRQTPAVLLTCGYSFGDEHVNEAILDGLRANPNAICFALRFGGLEGCPTAVGHAERHSNLIVLARDGAIIGTRRGAWEAVPTGNENAEGGEDEVKGGQFLLGDFAELGEFFGTALGRGYPQTQDTHGA